MKTKREGISNWQTARMIVGFALLWGAFVWSIGYEIQRPYPQSAYADLIVTTTQEPTDR